eukprot:scaffold1815_cov147-Skeletonema_dohrnii-CCMP3373.AAC.7
MLPPKSSINPMTSSCMQRWSICRTNNERVDHDLPAKCKNDEFCLSGFGALGARIQARGSDSGDHANLLFCVLIKRPWLRRFIVFVPSILKAD